MYKRQVIVRRTQFELNKAEARAHILEGLKIALDHIDAIIALIKKSNGDEEAQQALMSTYNLSEKQAQAILEMKLRRLTGLERSKIEAELADLLESIAELKSILASNEKVMEIIKKEMLEIRDRYGDERRTDIDMTAIEYIEDESLIPVEDIVVTLTNKGYIKRMLGDTYKTQNRGGVGVKGMSTNEEDFAENIISMQTHDYILFFTNRGKVYRMKGYEIPEFNRQSKGLPIVNLLPLEKDETVNTMIQIERESVDKYFLFATKMGIVKRTLIDEFENIRTTGKIAITLREEDELISVKKTTGANKIALCSDNGRMIVTEETEIRVMGRTASGVKGIDLGNSNCIGADIVQDDSEIIVITENGYGKKTHNSEYRTTHRGSKGVKTLNVTDKTGKIITFKSLDGEMDLMIVTTKGIVIRISSDQIPTLGRVTQGVRLINLKNEQTVATVALIEQQIEEIEEQPTEE